MSFSEPMTSDSSVFHQRNNNQHYIFLWGAVGLQPKQALVLKSMMRLVDHKLDHKWFYSTTTMDLCINADDCPDVSASGYQDATGQPARMLTLGVRQKDQTGFLSLPLYVGELLQTVNRIGHEIQLKKSAVAEALLRSVSILPNTFLRLKRWPPAHLLGTPDRIRMATLLTGQPLALQELQRKARLPMAACETFVNDMRRAGLLGTAEIVQPAMPVTTMPATTTSSAVKKATTSAPIKPGLLDKIRSRLGLGMSARS